MDLPKVANIIMPNAELGILNIKTGQAGQRCTTLRPVLIVHKGRAFPIECIEMDEKPIKKVYGSVSSLREIL